MQASGILYDRSSDGEYFHIYTERSPTGCLRSRAARRGYDAYGALDAPARIASQAQQPSDGMASKTAASMISSGGRRPTALVTRGFLNKRRSWLAGARSRPSTASTPARRPAPAP